MYDQYEATLTEPAERAVIGSALADPSAIRFAADHITQADFSSDRLGAVWGVLHRRWKAGEPTDVVAMDVVLRTELDGYKPGSALDLMDSVPYGGTASYWAEQIADGARRREAIQAGTRLVQGAASGDLAEAVAGAKRDLGNIGSTGSGQLTSRPLARILEETDAYDWVIPGILEKMDRVIFTGGEGGGKSTLVRQIAVLSAAGINPFTLEDMEPVRVLVIDAENSERQWRRATRDIVAKASRHLGADVGELIPLSCIVDQQRNLDVSKERDLSAIHDLVDTHQPDIVFIGPLYKITSRALQTDDEATPVLRALDSIRARGAALVMEAHAGVPGQQGRDLRPRGSAALLGWPEFGIGLAVDKDYLPFQQDPDNFKNRKVDLTRWRGDRDTERVWPKSIYPNNYWRWGPEPYSYTADRPNPVPYAA